jgi:flagellar L-ring protein precursor FlgH
MKRGLSVAVLALAVAGCSRPYLEEPPWPAPTPIARAPEGPKPSVQSTSLWSDGAALTGVYDDHRARRLGDLVTVVVVESSQASREANTAIQKDSSVDASVGAFLGSPMDLGLDHLYGKTGFQPTVKAGTANSFKGAGTTTRKDALNARVAARVVNILEDGNLVIEGRRQVKVNEETQYLFVRGIARASDIGPDNTVSSVALADAQILYGGNGLVASQQKPGWLYRIVDAVWPF